MSRSDFDQMQGRIYGPGDAFPGEDMKLPDCNADYPGPNHYTCDLPAGHTGDHFGGNSGGTAASWPQQGETRINELQTGKGTPSNPLEIDESSWTFADLAPKNDIFREVEEPPTDGVLRAHFKCPRTQLTVQVDPTDYEIVSNRIVKIKFCPLCLGEHHLRAWSE